MKNKLFNNSGFTLSEILISLQIFSLLILFVYAANRVFYQSYLKQIRHLNQVRSVSQIQLLIRENLNQVDEFQFKDKLLIGFNNGVEKIRFSNHAVLIKNRIINDSLKLISMNENNINLMLFSNRFSFSIN